MLRFPCGLVLIQDNGLRPTAAAPVQPHAGLAGHRLPGFLQYLQRRLIAMKDFLPAELPGSSAGSFGVFRMLASPLSSSQFLQAQV